MSPVIPVKLHVSNGRMEKVHTQLFAQETIKIGTLESNHMCIDDPTASRMHAVIDVVGPKVFIWDLGSKEGTLLNGSKIRNCELHNGDRIKLGCTTILIQIGDSAL